MQPSTSTSWQADLGVNRARRAGLTGFTGRAPMRGLLSVSEAGWSWTPDERAARRGVPPIRPADGWALTGVEWRPNIGARATFARRSGEVLILDVPDGYGLENHQVASSAGYPRPVPSPGWFVTRGVGIVLGLVVGVSSFVSAAGGESGPDALPWVVLLALGVLGLFFAGYAATSLLGNVRRRR